MNGVGLRCCHSGNDGKRVLVLMVLMILTAAVVKNGYDAGNKCLCCSYL